MSDVSIECQKVIIYKWCQTSPRMEWKKEIIILEKVVGESSPENNNGMSVHLGKKKNQEQWYESYYENKRNYGVSVHHEKKKKKLTAVG